MENKDFFSKSSEYAKAWSVESIQLFKNPREAIAALPVVPSLERPLVYGALTGISTGVIYASSLMRFSVSAGLSTLISMTVLCPIALLVGAFVINLTISILGKDPGYYKTVNFLSRAAMVVPVAALASLIFPILSMLASGLMCYALYFYARVAGEVEKNKAIGLVVALAVLPFLSAAGVMGMLFLPMMMRF